MKKAGSTGKVDCGIESERIGVDLGSITRVGDESGHWSPAMQPRRVGMKVVTEM